MLETLLPLIWILIKIICIVLPLLLAVAYLTLLERKVIAYMQARIGPNRVGILGLLQPIADLIKLIFKEIILPAKSNRFLFIIAPILALTPAFAAWAVVPFSEGIVLSDINAGVLYLFAMSSLSVYSVLISGWASNSKYAMFGALRAAAQTVSYEIAMGFALVGVLMAAGSMNVTQIVHAQAGGVAHWFVWPLLPLMVVFWIAGVAETNRAPFDLSEGESEIVAGFHVEYSGLGFSLFFLAEYANMILISVLMALFFFGGWHAPIESLNFIPGVVWLFLKAGFFVFLYLWLRATFPRYRYDQLMRLGWKVLIPVTLVWIVVESVMIKMGLVG